MITHSEIVKQVAKLLWENDFYVRTQRSIPIETTKGLEVYHALTQKKPEWTAIVDVLGLKMRTDGIGPLVRGTNGKRLHMLGETVAVEVSMSSDVKKEVNKLRKLPIKLRLVVTADSRMRGELAGIPIVPYERLDSTVIKNLKQTYYCDSTNCDYFTRNFEDLLRHRRRHEKHWDRY